MSTETEIGLERFEIRAEKLLSRVFKGIHHVHSLKKFSGKDGLYWTCVTSTLATYDFDQLTRLVFAAHEYCCRIEVKPGGPNRLKLFVHPRERKGSIYESHPTIEQAFEKWNV